VNYFQKVKHDVPELPRTKPHVAIDLLKTSPCTRGAGVITLADIVACTLVLCTCRSGIYFATTSDAIRRVQR
jgi:hypothetical protein